MPFLNVDGLVCGLVRDLKGYREKVPVPLKSVNVRVEVMDFLAEVTVEQEYVNTEERRVTNHM